MKRFVLPCLFVVALCAIESRAADAEKKSWFDLQNCSICKHMGQHMEMMQSVTWETHKIPTGMLSISVIPEKYRKTMDDAHQKMLGTIAQLETGKQMPLCGFCTSYGGLVMSGAESKDIKTDFGMIGTLTSTDSDVVKKIHEHADRTIKEYKAFLASAAQGN